MTAEAISNALRRARAIFARRPQAAIHADAAAVARWDGNTRVISRHANGTEFVTDMPTELGGAGEQVTPGWLLRAGLASCLATRIAMEAADRNIELTDLEVRAESVSDARGLLGMTNETGDGVSPAPTQVSLTVCARSNTASREITTPMEYLTQWRMLMAANLLRGSNASLTRIADDVGYQTDTAFIRAFRREFGVPPATWRRQQPPGSH